MVLGDPLDDGGGQEREGGDSSVATDEDDVVDGAVVHLGFLASSHGNVPLLNLSTIHIC